MRPTIAAKDWRRVWRRAPKLRLRSELDGRGSRKSGCATGRGCNGFVSRSRQFGAGSHQSPLKRSFALLRARRVHSVSNWAIVSVMVCWISCVSSRLFSRIVNPFRPVLSVTHSLFPPRNDMRNPSRVARPEKVSCRGDSRPSAGPSTNRLA